jgi:hypothetical protein
LIPCGRVREQGSLSRSLPTSAQAGGDEILVSSLLKELTESGGDIAFGEGREVELKGLSGSQRVFEVGWRRE